MRPRWDLNPRIEGFAVPAIRPLWYPASNESLYQRAPPRRGSYLHLSPSIKRLFLNRDLLGFCLFGFFESDRDNSMFDLGLWLY